MSHAGPLAPAEYRFLCDDGPPVDWHVRRFELREALSEPYALTVELLATDLAADTDRLLGARCSLQLTRGGDGGRVVHGVIVRVYTLGLVGERLRVRVDVGPALALLAHQVDTRFWQRKTAAQILRLVLKASLAEHGCALELRLDESALAEREYCVQYRESDLDFAARLMAEEGLVYFFLHPADGAGETLVLVDTTAGAAPLEHPPVPFVAVGTGTAGQQSLAAFDWQRELTTTGVVERDWDWQDTGASPYDHARVDIDDRGRVRARLHHDARRLHRDDGAQRARRALEGHTARADQGRGQSDVLEMLPGHTVSLVDLPRPDLEGDHLIVRVVHTGDAPEEEQYTPGTPSARYQNTFETLRAGASFRASRAPARPCVYGPHTAIVVGPPGEEIHTDEHGRIKVRFHWDRHSPADDTASCWIRVAQAWAGPGWGAVFLPRVGMEVLVEFLDGDPDRPLVTGSVYNSLHQPPYPLPDQRTRSAIRTDSTPGGGGHNELRFEDARGREELLLRAQRDLRELALHDHIRSVGHDQRVEIGGAQTIDVTGDRAVTVREGDESLTVTAGRSTTTVHGDRSVTVTTGDSALTVARGKHATVADKDISLESINADIDLEAGGAVTVLALTDQLKLSGHKAASLVSESAELTLRGEGDVRLVSRTAAIDIHAPEEVHVHSPQDVRIRGNTLLIHATEKLELSVGASSIVLEPGGITLKSATIDSTAIGTHNISGALIRLN